MNPSIFSQLPNDLIMNIIKKTKTSLDYKYEHACLWEDVTFAIEEVVEEFPDGYLSRDHIWSDQFFCQLFHNEALTDTIVKYRRNRSPLACLLGIPTSWLA